MLSHWAQPALDAAAPERMEGCLALSPLAACSLSVSITQTRHRYAHLDTHRLTRTHGHKQKHIGPLIHSQRNRNAYRCQHMIYSHSHVQIHINTVSTVLHTLSYCLHVCMLIHGSMSTLNTYTLLLQCTCTQFIWAHVLSYKYTLHTMHVHTYTQSHNAPTHVHNLSHIHVLICMDNALTHTLSFMQVYALTHMHTPTQALGLTHIREQLSNAHTPSFICAHMVHPYTHTQACTMISQVHSHTDLHTSQCHALTCAHICTRSHTVHACTYISIKTHLCINTL